MEVVKKMITYTSCGMPIALQELPFFADSFEILMIRYLFLMEQHLKTKSYFGIIAIKNGLTHT